MNLRKKQEANLLDVKVHLDLYVYTSCVNYEAFKKISLGLNKLMFLCSLPCCDVIKTDLIIKQDGGRLVSFVLQYFRNYACYETFNNRYHKHLKGFFG